MLEGTSTARQRFERSCERLDRIRLRQNHSVCEAGVRCSVNEAVTRRENDLNARKAVAGLYLAWKANIRHE
jgi:hypothetical protein